MNIDELIERAQREIDSIDGYTRMATTAHDLLDEAITALREQQERLSAPLPEEVACIVESLRLDPTLQTAADLIERLAREREAAIELWEPYVRRIEELEERPMPDVEAYKNKITELESWKKNSDEWWKVRVRLAERQRDEALAELDRAAQTFKDFKYSKKR